MNSLRWWVSLWDRREGPQPQALVRIFLCVVLVVDWVYLRWLGLVTPLFAPAAFGGMGMPMQRTAAGLWLYEALPPQWVAEVSWWLVLGLMLMVGVGLLTRLSALLLVLLLAQLAIALPGADRGIDMLNRNILLLLVFAHSHRVWSVDAWLWRGGAAHLVPAWPRYLIMMQVVVLYFTAGVQKVATSWSLFGGYSALYIAMRDPAFAVFSPEFLRAVYPLTQVLTAGSVAWEWLAPCLLLALYFRDTRTRSGRLRRTFLRLHIRSWYLFFGFCFHVGTAFGLQLGIFPWAVLALYPACFHPDEVESAWRRIRRRG